MATRQTDWALTTAHSKTERAAQRYRTVAIRFWPISIDRTKLRYEKWHDTHENYTIWIYEGFESTSYSRSSPLLRLCRKSSQWLHLECHWLCHSQTTNLEENLINRTLPSDYLYQQTMFGLLKKIKGKSLRHILIVVDSHSSRIRNQNRHLEIKRVEIVN